jgi:hypothetical protein
MRVCFAASRPSRRSEASRSEPRSALFAVAAGGNALITNVVPAGKVPSRPATRWRSRRLTRWRTTELPTALLTTKPALAASAGPGGSVVSAWTTRRRLPALTPRRRTTRKSSLRRTRAAAGNTARLDDGRIRRTASRGPCDGGHPRWPGRRESACADGTRGSERDGGCSAGRCAYPCSRLKISWSRLRSPVVRRVVFAHGSLWCLLPTCGPVTSSDDYPGTQNTPTAGGRPYEGTHPLPGHRNHPLDHTRRSSGRHWWNYRAATEWQHAVHREMLASATALWQGAALVSVPLSGLRCTCTVSL